MTIAIKTFPLPIQPDHKMQSSSSLTLELCQVPKLLGPLRKEWAPQAFIVSFKLETDPEQLIPKAQLSLSSYHQHVVIANLLNLRHLQVTFVSDSSEKKVEISDSDISEGRELEELIVAEVDQRYKAFATQS